MTDLGASKCSDMAVCKAARSPKLAKKVSRAALAVGTLLVAGGWYFRTASPSDRFLYAVRSLRTGDAEGVQYQLLALERLVEYEPQTSLLRGWLEIVTRSPRDPDRMNIVWNELSFALEDPQTEPLALALMGRAAYEGGRLGDALKLLDQSLKLDPDEVEAHRWFGIVLYDLGLTGPAMEHLNRVAEVEPRNGRPHRLIALMLADRRDYDAAVAAYQDSLNRDPDQPDADEIQKEWAGCLFAQHRYDEALEIVGSCQPSAEGLLLQAQCHYAKANIAQAEALADAALQLDPDDPATLAFKATLVGESGDAQAAAKLLARAVQRKPQDYHLRYRLVQAYRRIGENDEAAKINEGLEELRQAGEEYRQLLQQADADFSDLALRYRIAALAQQLGFTDAAGNWLRAAQMLETSLAGSKPTVIAPPLVVEDPWKKKPFVMSGPKSPAFMPPPKVSE